MVTSLNPYFILTPPRTRKYEDEELFPVSPLESNPTIEYQSTMDDIYNESNKRKSSILTVRDITVQREEDKPIVKVRKRRKKKIMGFSKKNDPSKPPIYAVRDNDLKLLMSPKIYRFASSRLGYLIPRGVLVTGKEKIYKGERKSRKKKLTAESSRLYYELIDGNVYDSSSICDSGL